MNADTARQLIALTEAATQEPWQLGTAGQCNVIGFAGDDVIGIARVSNERNREYIAALSPAVVKELALVFIESAELLEDTANMLRGMTLDPAIPSHAKDAMRHRIATLESAARRLIESGDA